MSLFGLEERRDNDMAKVCYLPALIFLIVICGYLLWSEEAPENHEDDEECGQS